MIQNLFLHEISADHYDEARPYFHPQVIRRLTELLPGNRIQRALDVGCGTGQSTEALASLSNTVIGLDASAAMLRHARKRDRFQYVQGVAEQLPFIDEEFQLITVASAIHWFDGTAFLQEAARVLQPQRWLVVFSSWFCGTMVENPSFKDWNTVYLRRFPSPPRHRDALSVENIAKGGFQPVQSEDFSHTEVYDLDRLIAYLTTQTNVTSALYEDRETPDSMRAWLSATLKPLFATPTGTFEFAGKLGVFLKTE